MPIYRGITRVKVLEGSNALFWKDPWLDEVMEDKYPRAFSNSREEDISVKDLLATTALNLAFHTPLSPQAFEEVCNLQRDTELIELDSRAHMHDAWTCTWEKGDYTAAQYYAHYFRDV